MHIKETSLHFRLYKFFLQWINAIKGDDFFYEQPRNKNFGLCEYMRVILIWGPLIVLLHLLLLALILYILIGFPMQSAGIGGLAVVYVPIAVIAGVIFALVWLKDRHDTRVIEKGAYDEDAKDDDDDEKETFWTLAGAYLKALKEKVCPILTLDTENEDK